MESRAQSEKSCFLDKMEKVISDYEDKLATFMSGQ